MVTGRKLQTRKIEPLGKKHDRAAFSCGKEKLDRYFREQASQDARRHIAAPFVAVHEERETVLGYYTLSAFAVELGSLPEATVTRLPHYPLVPATLLGRLAVDQTQKGGGLGEFLLTDELTGLMSNLRRSLPPLSSSKPWTTRRTSSIVILTSSPCRNGKTGCFCRWQQSASYFQKARVHLTPPPSSNRSF